MEMMTREDWKEVAQFYELGKDWELRPEEYVREKWCAFIGIPERVRWVYGGVGGKGKKVAF
jgi:hypothetical protein